MKDPEKQNDIVKLINEMLPKLHVLYNNIISMYVCMYVRMCYIVYDADTVDGVVIGKHIAVVVFPAIY